VYKGCLNEHPMLMQSIKHQNSNTLFKYKFDTDGRLLHDASRRLEKFTCHQNDDTR